MREACVKSGSDGGAVKVLTDEDYFLHPIAINLVPVAPQVGIAAH